MLGRITSPSMILSSPKRALHSTVSNWNDKSDTLRIQETDANETDEYLYRRDLESMLVWAAQSGVKFAPGLQLVEGVDHLNDWGLAMTQPQERGTAILTVPAKLLLSSNDQELRSIKQWMRQQPAMKYPTNLPECLLMVRILQELYNDSGSLWYPWLRSLPTSFSTGLYLDDLERYFVQRMAPEFLEEQQNQWETCRATILSLIQNAPADVVSTQFQNWLSQRDDLEDLLRWTFTIVFTRRWKTPNHQDATIVPLGDMINHDSQKSNLQPFYHKDDSEELQLCLTESGTGGAELFLSYGMSDYPARFLVHFGFCDLSAPYVQAHIDLGKNVEKTLEEYPPVDTTQLVVSTTDGAISEEVWNVFLYKVLRQSDPMQLQRLQAAFDVGDAEFRELLEELMSKWEWEAGLALRSHIQDVLETMYAPISVSESDLCHHFNLATLVNYNLFLRETFVRALGHVNMVLDQAKDFRKMKEVKKDYVT